MASRLSDEAIKSSYESGVRGVAVRRPRKLPDLIDATVVNIEELLSMEAVEEAVQAVDPVAMYRAIMAKGPSDCLDLLPYLSTEQVTRIFDYEAWREDRLEPLRAINWLMLFNELGPTDMFDRLKEQEEEFQLALLGPMIELLDEDEFEKIKDHAQDEYVALPCHTLYYKVKSEDPRVQQFVQSLVGSGLESDLRYTYGLLAHAAYVPPTEQEALLSQFRRARLEEDGFVSLEESVRLFARIDIEKLKTKWCPETRPDTQNDTTALVPGSGENDSAFFARVLTRMTQDTQGSGQEAAIELQRSVVHTANMLCTATGTDAGDDVQLRDILYNMQSLLSLGLEWLSAGDVSKAVELVQRIHPQELFRTGLTLVAAIGDDVISAFKLVQLVDADRIANYWRADKRGSLVHWLEVNHLDFFGYERLEFLKGLFNRFPMLVSDATVEESRRRYFQPVISLSDIQELRLQALSFIQELELVAATCTLQKPGFSIDKILATAIARTCIQGSFLADPLTEEEVKRLASLDQDHLAAAFEKSSQAIKERILHSASIRQESLAAEVAERTLTGLSDIYLHFIAALRSAGSADQDQFNFKGLGSTVLLNNKMTETSQHA